MIKWLTMLMYKLNWMFNKKLKCEQQRTVYFRDLQNSITTKAITKHCQQYNRETINKHRVMGHVNDTIYLLALSRMYQNDVSVMLCVWCHACGIKRRHFRQQFGNKSLHHCYWLTLTMNEKDQYAYTCKLLYVKVNFQVEKKVKVCVDLLSGKRSHGLITSSVTVPNRLS